MSETVHVSFFSEFKMTCKGAVLTQETLHSLQLTRLLVYLLLYRKKILTVQDMTEVLWPGGETANPAGALKNLMYRLRQAMKCLGNETYILSKGSGYIWNPQIPVSTDFDRFENACAQARKPGETVENEKRISLYEKALQIYAGPVFSDAADEPWMIPLATYYHSLYVSIVKELSALYEKTGNYLGMGKICQRALEEDSLDEDLHYWLIRALIGKKNQQLAIDHYNKATRLLYDKLGVRSSSRLREAYSMLVSMENTVEVGLSDFLREVYDRKETEGISFCDYKLFCELCRMETRRQTGAEHPEYVTLLTMKMDADGGQDEQALYLLKRGMEKLKDAMDRVLPAGTAASRCSETQYILLLEAESAERCAAVCERLLQVFRGLYGNLSVRVQYETERL